MECISMSWEVAVMSSYDFLMSLLPCRPSSPALSTGIAVDKNGLIYFVDGTTIRKVDQNGIISTFLGSNDLTSARPLTCDNSMDINQVSAAQLQCHAEVNPDTHHVARVCWPFNLLRVCSRMNADGYAVEHDCIHVSYSVCDKWSSHSPELQVSGSVSFSWLICESVQLEPPYDAGLE